jgi:IS30 family transposase
MHQKFKQLTQQDRDRIQNMKYYGATCVQIAEALEVHKSTVSRELKRHINKHGNYRAEKAQQKAEEKRSGSKVVGMKIESNFLLKQHIITGLQELRSPDEIAGRMKKEKVSPRVGTNAIYKWLYSEHGEPYRKYLCSKRIRRKAQSRTQKRILIPNRISLRARPVGEIYQHGESDLFVSPTNLHTSTVGHMTVIPSSKLLTGTLLPNKSPHAMVSSMQQIQKKIQVTSWTMDNGFENIYHEQFGIPTYFCTRGSPWQKPHVENNIGLLRRWFLKRGTDLSKVEQEAFQSMLYVLNSKYRKSLGYANAYEVSLKNDIIKKVPKLSKKQAVAFR